MLSQLTTSQHMMKKTFSARRVPRKIGQDVDDSPSNASPSNASQTPDSAIRRPTAKPRKSSSLRSSIGPSGVDDDEDSEASVVTPKRSNLSRIAIQRNASKQRTSLLASQLPMRQLEDEGDDRPNYSAAHLAALKNSTPSTPQEFTSASASDVEDVSAGTRDLDLSLKFGSSLARYDPQQQSSVIPSAGEIAEKKARRARLAKERQAEEYISLDLDDPNLDDEDLDDSVMRDESGRLVLKPKDKYGQGESRLVREDEDIMENFEEFTEDGRISLGRKAEAEAARRRKQEMATQIAEAEGASDSDSDDSERERRVAYENAQTKHGTNTQRSTSDSAAAARPKTPPIVTPIPTFESAVEHLRKQISDMQTSRMKKLQEMEALHRETARLAQEEVHIQRALKETAEEYETLRKEKGISSEVAANKAAVEMPSALVQNGSSNPGAIASNVDQADIPMSVDTDSDDADEQQSGFAGAGLGFGASMRGRGGLGLGAQSAEEDSDDY